MIVKMPFTEFLVSVLGKNVQLIDIRTPDEYLQYYIKGATNLDWSRPDQFQKALEILDRTEPLYMYCGTGKCSLKAGQRCLKLGFSKIYQLDGGIAAIL